MAGYVSGNFSRVWSHLTLPSPFPRASFPFSNLPFPLDFSFGAPPSSFPSFPVVSLFFFFFFFFSSPPKRSQLDGGTGRREPRGSRERGGTRTSQTGQRRPDHTRRGIGHPTKSPIRDNPKSHTTPTRPLETSPVLAPSYRLPLTFPVWSGYGCIWDTCARRPRT